MEYLVNDLSLHGQFHDIPQFEESINKLIEIRTEIERLGLSLDCHRNLVNAKVTPNHALQQAAQSLPGPRRSALLVWITRTGPHWEDTREHAEDDWLEVDGQIVTDSAVGETAVCCWRDDPRELVSFAPSNWQKRSINVSWVREDARQVIKVENHWELDTVHASLAAHPVLVNSWATLEEYLRQACPHLTIAGDAFRPRVGHPFSPGAARKIQALMSILNKMKTCFNDNGERTDEGRKLYDEYFVGAKAWFSDSSDREKAEFNSDLTFPNPTNPGTNLFCTWHGKVKTPQYRIHFSWPASNVRPLCVVYIGPKITKR